MVYEDDLIAPKSFDHRLFIIGLTSWINLRPQENNPSYRKDPSLVSVHSSIWGFPEIGVPPNHLFFVDFSWTRHLFWATPIYGNIHMNYMNLNHSLPIKQPSVNRLLKNLSFQGPFLFDTGEITRFPRKTERKVHGWQRDGISPRGRAGSATRSCCEVAGLVPKKGVP